MAALKLALILMSLVEASSMDIKSDFVVLKTQYTFPGDASTCRRAEWRKTSPTDTATIATSQNQNCLIENGFHEEFTCKENHLLLNSAIYTDQGLYEFICDEVTKTLKLDVLYLITVYAAVMDNITLPCYEASAKDVTWIHNKDRFLHYKKDGYKHIGDKYKGRASLEKNCFETSDFSLTITGFRETDAGTYRCFLNDEGTKGYPHVYHVKEKPSSQGDQTDTSNNEAQTLTIYKMSTIILGIISSILLVVVVVLLYKLHCTSKPLKDQSTPPTPTYQKTDDDTTDNIDLLDNTESQPMVSQPVQESDTKSSVRVI